VPVRIAFFEDRMDAFARAQGYGAQGYPATDPVAQAAPALAVDG
jgi:hypothetical protein